MNNLKKIILSTFILSTLAGGSCFCMGRGGQISCTFVQDDRKECEILRGKINELVNYIQLLNKVQPGSQIAEKTASFLLQKSENSYKYKEQIKALAAYLKDQNVLTDEEYNKFIVVLG